MKTIKIKKLVLRNFKGIKLFEGNFSKIESFIRGENATGKSSVLDGICWCIDGKNAAGVSDSKFNIKTLDQDNQPIHKLEHSCELTLEIDGMERKLKRVYKELHQKKRGTNEQVFKGHTTDFFVDEMEKKEGEYRSAVADIIGVSIEEFLMISNPLYFIYRMEWKERRKILCDMAGEVSYNDIILDKKFEELDIELDKHSPDDYKKHCENSKKNIAKQLKDISPRMSELDKLEGVLSQIDFPGIEKKVVECDSVIAKNHEKIKGLTNESAVSNINIEFGSRLNKVNEAINKNEELLINTKSQRNAIVAEASHETENKISEKKELLQNEKNKGATLKSTFEGVQARQGTSESELNELTIQRDELRKKGAAVMSREFSFIADDGCPTCKRAFTTEDKTSQESTAKEGHLKGINDDLETINSKGKALTSAIEKIEKDVEILGNQSTETWKQITVQKEVVEKIQEEIAALEKTLSNVWPETEKVDKQVIEINGAIDQLRIKSEKIDEEKTEAINNLTDDAVVKTRTMLEEVIKEAESQKKTLSEELSQKGQLTLITKQKGELLDEEDRLTASHSRWERQLWLVEQLIRDYVTKIERSVNAMFTHVKFKLFEIQQNGGINQTCQVLLGGVPDGDINTAGVMKAGVDIINALSSHYQVTAPIVIDNRESITEIIPTESQIINLIKDSSFSILTQAEE